MATKGEGADPLDPGSDKSRVSGPRGLTAPPPHTHPDHTRAHTRASHTGVGGGGRGRVFAPTARSAKR